MVGRNRPKEMRSIVKTLAKPKPSPAVSPTNQDAEKGLLQRQSPSASPTSQDSDGKPLLK